MPIINGNGLSSLDKWGKYGIYVSNSIGGTYTLCKRLIVKQFRNELKSLGAGSAELIPKNRMNELADDVNLKVGQFIKILDVSVNQQDTYTTVGQELFTGTISAVTENEYEGAKDSLGLVTFNEIGWYYKSQPMISNKFSSSKLFNPIISGYAYANKKDQTYELEEVFDNMGRSPTTSVLGQWDTSFDVNLKVWSLEGYFKWIMENNSFDIQFPWETDAIKMDENTAAEVSQLNDEIAVAQTLGQQGAAVALIKKRDDTISQASDSKNAQADAYKYFKDVNYIRSFEFDPNQSVYDNIEKYLSEPFDFYLINKSTSAPTMVIINKSPVAVPNTCPAALLTDFTIDPKITTNFNMTADDEYYHKLVYRGDFITYCGTLHAWNHNQSASIKKGWTDQEEKDYVWGQAALKENGSIDSQATQKVRLASEKVYKKFEFLRKGEKQYLKIAGATKDNKGFEFTEAPMFPVNDGTAAFTMNTFFPTVSFWDYTGGIPHPKGTPLVSYGGDTTPDPMSLTWVTPLPFNESPNSTLDDRELGKAKEPFAIAFGVEGKSAEDRVYTPFQITRPGLGFDTGRIEWGTDGFNFNCTAPEKCLAFYDRDTFTCSDTLVDSPADYWSVTTSGSPAANENNPLLTTYPYKANWKQLAFTVAIKSNQKMEVTLDNINTTDEYKIKVIEDPSLQCQIIHCGTIKDLFQVPANVQSGTGRKYRTGVIRATAIEYGRNDYLKLYDMAKAMAEYYFLEKNSATIETSLMKTSASLPLGAVVGNIKDKDKWVPTNTAVSSVEYNIDVNRKTISTSKPVIPLFKNLERKSQGIKANTAVDIAPAPKIVEKKLPEPSGVIAGGGTSTPVTYDAFKIQGINNTLYPSPLHGIIWSANMPANNRVTTDYTNLAIAEGLNTDTGFGIGQSIFTGERKLIANLGLVSISGSGVPWTTSLMNGNVVTLGSATVDVSGFHGSPPAVVLYKAYIPTDRY